MSDTNLSVGRGENLSVKAKGGLTAFSIHRWVDFSTAAIRREI
jgi:hypothetical protein